MEELIATRPAAGRALLTLEAHRLRILLTALESYATQPLEQHLVNRLLMLAAHHGVPNSQGLGIQLHLPQETLAQLIGATRQRVNQLLKEWEAAGIVRQRYGETVVVDQLRLERIAEM